MCGLAGVVQTRAPVDLAALARVRASMTHRGPDGSGIWRSEDERVGLAHCRLAILDLSDAGLQPMHDAQRELCIVYNGEIYNYRELARELVARGHRLRSGTDTEVVLEAYRAWGRGCLDRLVGMFSFAIYDARNRTLFLARDRAGEKPLFYWHHAGGLQFASELKALFAYGDVPRQLDRDALQMYLAYGFVTGGECILRGVRKLPPAHALTYHIDTGKLESRRYWDLPSLQPDAAEPAQLEAELGALLEQSVRGQLVADVPVGVLLSGGVDSSLVTAVAARVSEQPIRTFTVSFPGHGAYDESGHARLVASHFGTCHSEIVAEPATVELLPKLAAQFDEPLGDSSMVPTYLVSRAIREHAVVALGGDGGDELFGGYRPYRWLVLQDRTRRWVPALIRRGVGAVAEHWLPMGFRGRNYLLGYGGDLSHGIACFRIFFDGPARARLLGMDSLHAAGSPEAYIAGVHRASSTVQRLTGTDFRAYLPDDILVKVDRASMLASLEVRAPLLDHRIIEFAFGRVPDSQKVTPWRRKVLLQSLAKRLLPPGFDVARKQGFSLPLSAWFRGTWGGFFRDVLLDSDGGCFHQREVRRLFQLQERGLFNSDRLFALTMFELWRREYGVCV